jgi:gluconolactonase
VEIELVTEGLLFPEGPIAMNDGSVILTEVQAGRLTRVTPDGKREVFAETGGGPNGAAVGPDNAIYVTNNGGSIEWRQYEGLTIPGPAPASYIGGYIQRIDLKSSKVSTIYDECEGRKFAGLNDLVFDKTGGIWFTDHGATLPEYHKHGALYYARPDGSKVVRHHDHMTSPNGVGLSPDESVVYMADTILGRLWAFDLTGPGEMRPPVGFAPGRVIKNLEGFQLLDSLAVEAGGKVCVATIINGGVTVFDPDGSIEHFAFPDILTTNICFGGGDMCDAWVTCASTGKLYKCRWPRPGLKLNFNA